MEVTERKDVQNGGRSILKMTTGFGLFSLLSKVNFFFLLFTSNLSYFKSFKLPYKIRLLGFRSPLRFKIKLLWMKIALLRYSIQIGFCRKSLGFELFWFLDSKHFSYPPNCFTARPELLLYRVESNFVRAGFKNSFSVRTRVVFSRCAEISAVDAFSGIRIATD